MAGHGTVRLTVRVWRLGRLAFGYTLVHGTRPWWRRLRLHLLLL